MCSASRRPSDGFSGRQFWFRSQIRRIVEASELGTSPAVDYPIYDQLTGDLRLEINYNLYPSIPKKGSMEKAEISMEDQNDNSALPFITFPEWSGKPLTVVQRIPAYLTVPKERTQGALKLAQLSPIFGTEGFQVANDLLQCIYQFPRTLRSSDGPDDEEMIVVDAIHE